MDFSASNVDLWRPMIQFGIIAALILASNILCRKIKWIRSCLLPTSVLAGFLMLLLRSFDIFPVDTGFLEAITYHALALGFIALSLRVLDKNPDGGALHGAKNGALIVSTYLVQALIGLAVSLTLAYTFMPQLFQASGVLLPMAFGQGPGQANNVGTTYEALGFAGGRSFGLSLAAAGYLCACIVGVIFLNVWRRKGSLRQVKEGTEEEPSGEVTIDTFQAKNEIPISESIDKFSIQMALIAVIYLITYLLTLGITELIAWLLPGMAETLGTLLWGFNFIVGSFVAILFRVSMERMKKANIIHRQYQNDYLLSRISGVAFDFMIVAGIASINLEDLSGNWLPFVLMAVLGGVGTFLYLRFMCRKMYPKYENEAFFGMFGMLTGTISSGVLLLRELDPQMKTPASGDLISGSSFGIAFGIPVLLLVSFAAQGAWQCLATFGILIFYLVALLLFLLRSKKRKTKK